MRFNNALVLVGFSARHHTDLASGAIVLTEAVLTATLYYDYLLTLSDEIEHFWKSANLSIMSVLFVVNRYFGLLGPIAVVIEYFGDISEMVGEPRYHEEILLIPCTFVRRRKDSTTSVCVRTLMLSRIAASDVEGCRHTIRLMR